MRNAKHGREKLRPARPRRPPPRHQLVLDESLARLGVRGVTSRRMFGGLCYYVDGKPFSILLGDSLALKLSAAQLTAAYERGDGQVFHPGGGDFVMREYVELGHLVLMDEDRLDAYVQASSRFIAGQETPEEELAWNDLMEGREGLYQQGKGKRSGREESVKRKGGEPKK